MCTKLSWITCDWGVRWHSVVLILALNHNFCFFFPRHQMLASTYKSWQEFGGLCLEVLERTSVLIVPLPRCLNPHISYPAKVCTYLFVVCTRIVNFWIWHVGEAAWSASVMRGCSETCGLMINSSLPHYICLVMKQLLVRLLRISFFDSHEYPVLKICPPITLKSDTRGTQRLINNEDAITGG